MITYLVSVIGILLLAAVAVFFWQKRLREEVTAGAKVEFERLQKTDPELLTDLPREKFEEIYLRTETPRILPYWLVAAAIFLLGTPIFMGLMGASVYAMKEIGWLPEPVEVAEGFLLEDGEAKMFRNTPPEYAIHLVQNYAGFYYFFGLLTFWIVVVWLVMRHYYKNKPSGLRDEIIRAR